MKIAITGGAGFIGRKLAQRLIARGFEPILIDSLSEQIHGEDSTFQPPVGATWLRIDIRNMLQFSEALDGCTAVFHLAAETGTAQSMYRIQQYVSVNELGTAALLEAIARCKSKPRALFLASSRSVYGEGAYVTTDAPETIVHPDPRTKEQLMAGQWQPLDEAGNPLQAIATPESLPFKPGSVYAATKASQELLLTASAAAIGCRVAIFRLQNVYGEGQSLQNPYTGIISIFLNRARQGLEIPIYEDGIETRDFVHVSDVCDALSDALEANLPNGTILNIGSGEATSVQGLAKQLLISANLSVPTRVTGQFRVGDVRHCYADITRARKLIGFTPKIDLANGLSRFCAWALDQDVYPDKLDRATAELRTLGLTN